MPEFYEFFAGGGMARAGLGADWNCLFGNDFDQKKSRTYKMNWGMDAPLKTCDIREICLSDLPGIADLVWASFPCQDLSLAGSGAGLRGERSGTFWPFWNLMRALRKEERAPRMIVLENVCGTITSHGGKDFSTICSALKALGYRFGAVVIEASLFVPQSRPRLFIVAVEESIPIGSQLNARWQTRLWHNRALVDAYCHLPKAVQARWLWWAIPEPARRKATFSDLVEDEPQNARWHTREETDRLLSLMSEVNLAKVEEAKKSGCRRVGTIYKRTRLDKNGCKVQRAEVRFDDVAGCLRTPGGGSSRQLIMIVEGGTVRTRLISARETARLMGLPDDYKLPDNYNEAYHLTGDGVVVPVVRHLAAHLLEPIISLAAPDKEAAA